MKYNVDIVKTSPHLLEEMLHQIQQLTDDYEGKEELVSGIKELLNDHSYSLVLSLSGKSTQETNTLRFKDLEIDSKTHKVIKNNQEVKLTPKEFDILYFLASNQGQVFTKEQIYQAVWEDNYLLDDSNIMAFIRKLRKKIETNPDDPQYIITVWGIGYKFNDKL